MWRPLRSWGNGYSLGKLVLSSQHPPASTAAGDTRCPCVEVLIQRDDSPRFLFVTEIITRSSLIYPGLHFLSFFGPLLCVSLLDIHPFSCSPTPDTLAMSWTWIIRIIVVGVLSWRNLCLLQGQSLISLGGLYCMLLYSVRTLFPPHPSHCVRQLSIQHSFPPSQGNSRYGSIQCKPSSGCMNWGWWGVVVEEFLFLNSNSQEYMSADSGPVPEK